MSDPVEPPVPAPVEPVANQEGELTDADLPQFWRDHVISNKKGVALPAAVFVFGALSDRAIETLEKKDKIWTTVDNRVLLRSAAMVHWDAQRRRDLHQIVHDIGDYIRTAEEVSLGNGQYGWRQPLLITTAKTGLSVPISIIPGDTGIEIRSLITPVSPHRLAKLRKKS